MHGFMPNNNNNGGSVADQEHQQHVVTPSQCWYVAQTHIHAESKATFHLERQGFGVYLPRYLKKRRHARRVDTVAAPLFPRYLFISVDSATQSSTWSSLSRLNCQALIDPIADLEMGRLIQAWAIMRGPVGYPVDHLRERDARTAKKIDGAGCIGQ